MLSDRGRKIMKIILFVLAICVVAIAVEAAVELVFMTNHEPSYFVKHFSLGTSLILIGIMAFLMTQVAKRRYEGGKGDELMLVVSVLLILCGFIAYMISYFNIY
ncbi:MAG: hypothetical protein IJU60_06770 [Acholeplasmatales bacterium]|nr:hypothetical protein [Acholeplasmatales bacterium]